MREGVISSQFKVGQVGVGAHFEIDREVLLDRIVAMVDDCHGVEAVKSMKPGAAAECRVDG